jgi:hypothetical protein
VQDAREVLGRHVEPRRDHRLRRGQREHVSAARACLAFVLPKQIADHALGSRLHRIGLDVADQAVQPARQPGKHLARERRVAVDLVIDDLLRHVQQHRIRERLCHKDVRLAHEHQRLAERVTGRDDLDHFFAALRREERELHLAVHDQMKAHAWIAAVEDDLAARNVQLRRAGRDAVKLFGSQLFE